jgi:hypothetical protein
MGYLLDSQRRWQRREGRGWRGWRRLREEKGLRERTGWWERQGGSRLRRGWHLPL